MSSHSLPESEDSTSDSNEQGSESLDNAKPTNAPAKSSPDTGPESPVTKTSQDSTPNGSEVMAFTQNQRDEIREVEVPGALSSQPGMKQQTYLLTSSAADSRARICQSPENAPDSQENVPACSSRPPESLTLFSETEDGFSLKMYPDSFPQTVDEISPSYSRRWPTSGFTTSLGESWTVDSSEFPNGGGVSSSLPDVLEDDVPPRFYLSPKACAGILRRAARRGKSLPENLEAELKKRAAQEGK